MGLDPSTVDKHQKMILLKEIHGKLKRLWDGLVENWLGHSPLDRWVVTNMETINGYDVYSLQKFLKEDDQKI